MCVLINSQCERDRYESGVRWLHDLLYGLKFSAERVVVVATKMVNDVSRYGNNYFSDEQLSLSLSLSLSLAG